LSDYSAPAPDTVCGSTHCITCGDDGTPMVVVSLQGETGLALCRGEDGAESLVETALVDPLGSGDCVLVHAGTAIAVVSQR
jgi:hydrogenase maturation factor